MEYINRFDKDGSCAKMGKSAEERFLKILQHYIRKQQVEAGQSTITEATLIDQFNHIDLYLKNIGIDVKAMKRLTRNSYTDFATFTWFEIVGARGKYGWIHSPHTKLFAFEYSEGFYLLTPKQCQEIAEKYQQYSTTPKVGYRYTRSSDQSVLVAVPLEDLQIGRHMPDPFIIPEEPNITTPKKKTSLDGFFIKKK